MSLLSFDRNQIVALAKEGLMNKKTILHYDVCQALKEGKTAEKIAELFQIAEPAHVRWIQRHKCPDCR